MREQIRLTCVTEGNPTPKISWLQQNGNGDQKVWNMRGRESTLVVNNATYEYQGVYICEAANEIKGKLYRVQSQEARVDIKGELSIVVDDSCLLDPPREPRAAACYDESRGRDFSMTLGLHLLLFPMFDVG